MRLLGEDRETSRRRLPDFSEKTARLLGENCETSRVRAATRVRAANVGAGLVPARWPGRASVRGNVMGTLALSGHRAGTRPAPTFAEKHPRKRRPLQLPAQLEERENRIPCKRRYGTLNQKIRYSQPEDTVLSTRRYGFVERHEGTSLHEHPSLHPSVDDDDGDGRNFHRQVG